jgi:hypothetical protein
VPEKKALDILPDLVLVDPDRLPHQAAGPIPAHRVGQFFPGGETNLETIIPGRPEKYGDDLPPQAAAVTVETSERVGLLENPLAGKGEGGFIHRLN